MKKLLALFLALAMVMSLAACSSSGSSEEDTEEATETTETEEETEEEEEVDADAENEEEETEEETETASNTISNGTTWSVTTNDDGTISVVDMWGYETTLEGTVEKIYSSSPIGTYMNYVLDPELMLGWNSELSEEALQYINEDYQDLAVYSSSSTDVEYVISLEPDIIVAYVWTFQKSYTKPL